MALIDTVPTTRAKLPSVLNRQSNGKLPSSLLRNFDGRGNLLRIVSYGMQALHIAAWHDQVKGFSPRIATRSVGRYRTYNQQLNLFLSRYTTSPISGRPVKYWDGKKWYLKKGMAMAATPGTSNHGWGCADDVAEERTGDNVADSMSDNQLRWMRDNAPDFGFGLETRKERWHWHWIAGDVLPARAVATLRIAGIPIEGIPGYENSGGTTTPPPPVTNPQTPSPTAPTKLPAPPATLKVGSSNANDVRWLQQLMKDCKWYSGAVSGVFDSATKNGVIAMQRAIGATPLDGVYGPGTAQKLADWLSSATSLITDAPPATLREGSSNANNVRWLQQILKERGWYTDPVDGVFGPKTTVGVKKMQAALGATQDGIYGQQTAERLASFLSTGKAPAPAPAPAPTPTPAPAPPKLITDAPPAGLYEGVNNPNNVRWLQQIMKERGWYANNVDGQFGPKTTEAVKKMQVALKTTADGRYGQDTAQRLSDYLNGKTTTPAPSPAPKPKLITDAPPASLKQGSTNANNVRWLQQIMKERGWHSGAVDGLFGSQTVASVKVMQKALGTTADGNYGPLTALLLHEYLKKK